MDNAAMQEKILSIINNEKPKTIGELVELVSADKELPRNHVIENILEMQKKGKITFKPSVKELPDNIRGYLLSNNSFWFWIMIVLSLGTIVSTFMISENNPLIILRYALGTIFIIFLPGYSLIKVLFPTKGFDYLERTVLSIGLSLSIVPLAGIILNFTPWGIRLVPITLFFTVFTVSLTTAGLTREYNNKHRKPEE